MGAFFQYACVIKCAGSGVLGYAGALPQAPLRGMIPLRTLCKGTHTRAFKIF